MEVVYANELKEDMGILTSYEFDLAFGDSENSFSIELDLEDVKLSKGYYIYIEGTEFGGIVDTMTLSTEKSVAIYSGRTWHGILASKIVEPKSGEDYRKVSGDLNAIIKTLLQEYSLTELFSAPSEPCGVSVSNYQFERYVDLHYAISRMLFDKGMKLKITVLIDTIQVEAVPADDYSELGEFDSDVMPLEIKRTWNAVNHLICLGKGDLKARKVLHYYADAKGNVSTKKTFTGLKEITAIYDAGNMDDETLATNGKNKLVEYQSQDIIKASLKESDDEYDVGDMVEAVEHHTGLIIKAKVTQKIVKISNDDISINYKIGG